MKASNEKIKDEIKNILRQIIEYSIRVDSFSIVEYRGGLFKLTIYDPYGNVIDFTKGTPYNVLCVAKSWLYPLLN